ncbi:MAG: hypothetical protein KF752_03590 [Pirellulaceae bacterium]|nr:hypothetical protein [Pirellulaceae bacterium]
MTNRSGRRQMLGTVSTVAAGCVVAGRHPWILADQPGSSLNNPIPQENAQLGTRDWMLTNTRIDRSSKYRCPWVEGYASHASILPGETLSLMISTQPASSVLIQVYRLGYYGGLGGRQVAEVGPMMCQTQSVPQPGDRRLMDCRWPTTVQLPIGRDWVSGVYVAKLTEQREQLQSYIIFIVKDQRRADLVFQCADHTWQAYNRWPSQFSLYDDGQNEWHWGGQSRVSFNRPYGKYCQILDAPLSTGSGEYFLWEFPFSHWLEAEGYNVTYVSNTDTHQDASSCLRGRGWLSVGHDEYWTIEMFRNVSAARDQGIHLGFFSGNAVCGRVEWDADSRSLWRVGVYGPPGGMRDFESMATLEHLPPYANELLGAHSTGPVTGGADWICSLPDHWIYQQTNMQWGDRIPGLIGWEYHGDPAAIEGLQVVATGPTQSAPGQPNGGVYTATVYPGPRGNIVFNAATCWWADGLSAPPGYQSPRVYTAPQGVDPRVQQITRNILARMLR